MHLSLHNVISVTIKPSLCNPNWRQLTIRRKELSISSGEMVVVEAELTLFSDSDGNSIMIERVSGDQVELIEA